MTNKTEAYLLYQLRLSQAEALKKKKNKTLADLKTYDKIKESLMRLDRRFRFSSESKPRVGFYTEY